MVPHLVSSLSWLILHTCVFIMNQGVSEEDLKAYFSPESYAEYQRTYEKDILNNVKLHIILEDIGQRAQLQLTPTEQTNIDQQVDSVIQQFEQQWKQHQKLQLKSAGGAGAGKNKDVKPTVDYNKVR